MQLRFIFAIFVPYQKQTRAASDRDYDIGLSPAARAWYF